MNEEEARNINRRLTELIHKCGRNLYFHSSWGIRQTEILKMLLDGPMCQKDIQEKLGVQPATVSETISKLEEKKLIKKSRDESDRRIAVIELTEIGRISAEKRLADNVIRTVGIPLSIEEKLQLIELLEKLDRGFADKDMADQKDGT